jgi:aminopeptidase N
MATPDPHSYYDAAQPRARHLHLNWFVDFERHQINGLVTLRMDKTSGGLLDLDARAIAIRSVYTQDGEEIAWTFGEEDPILGQRLRLDLPQGTTSISIDYTTSPEAVALQWLEPEMTRGKRYPFLYSQCHIHARTIVPCRTRPRVRVS